MVHNVSHLYPDYRLIFLYQSGSPQDMDHTLEYLACESLRRLGIRRAKAESLVTLCGDAFMMVKAKPAPDVAKDVCMELDCEYRFVVKPKLAVLNIPKIDIDRALKYIAAYALDPDSVTVITGKPASGKSYLVKKASGIPNSYCHDEFWYEGSRDAFFAAADKAALSYAQEEHAPLILSSCLPEFPDPTLHLHVYTHDFVRRRRIAHRGRASDSHRVLYWDIISGIERILFDPAMAKADFLVYSGRKTHVFKE